MKLCLSILLFCVGLAAAGPVQEAWSRLFDKELMSEIQRTGTKCARRAHKVVLKLGDDEYNYEYRACKNHNNGMQCVLNRPGKLPNPCEEGANYDDCFEIEWYVRGQSTLFDICDNYGVPCQKPIEGFMLTNDKGRCDRRTAIQGVKLCEQGSDGRDDCTEVPMMSSNADIEADDSEEDCFCFKNKDGEKICRGACPTKK